MPRRTTCKAPTASIVKRTSIKHTQTFSLV